MGINPKRGGWKENEYIFSSGKSGGKEEKEGEEKLTPRQLGIKAPLEGGRNGVKKGGV